MPLPWLTALKLIPWTDVISATPQIVKGARNLYDGVRGGAGKKTGRSPDASAPPPPVNADPHALAAHVQHLQEHVMALEDEQTRAAELLQSLAEQNAQVIAKVETLRQRSQLLMRLSAGLGIAVVVLAVVVARI